MKRQRTVGLDGDGGSSRLASGSAHLPWAEPFLACVQDASHMPTVLLELIWCYCAFAGVLLREWPLKGTKTAGRSRICVAADNLVYVVYVMGRPEDRVQVFTGDGQFVREWGRAGELAADAAVSTTKERGPPQATVWVADYWNDRVQGFTPTGQFAQEWPGLTKPCALAWNAHHRLLHVADAQGLHSFSATNRCAHSWPAGPASTQEAIFREGSDVYIEALAVGRDGRLYATVSNTIEVFDVAPDGRLEFLREITLDHEPAALAMDSDGLVYTADDQTHRIVVSTPDGTVVRAWGDTNGHLLISGPFSLAFGPSDGLLYVTDSTHVRVYA